MKHYNGKHYNGKLKIFFVNAILANGKHIGNGCRYCTPTLTKYLIKGHGFRLKRHKLIINY